MSATPAPPVLIRDLAVPRSLLAAPDRFGGRTDKGLLRGDLLFQGGRIVGFTGAPPEGARVIEGGGRLLLPALVEPHVHLDKAFTAPRLPRIGGDLLAAIHAEEADKALWTDHDLRQRAERALAELVEAGVSHVRSHVDWGQGDDPAATPRAWGVLGEVAQDWAGRINLQLAALPAIDLLADPATADRIALQVARDGGCLGAWVLGHEARAEGIAAAFVLAERHGLPLDFHADEGQMPGLDGLALIVAEKLRTGFQGPVLCGHAVSLSDLAGDPLHRLLDDIARAQIALCALPTTNLYLQSRGQGTPDRRGITRLAEAADAGVTTCLGTDNVQDAFYPLGRHDPLLTLALAVPALHLDPPLETHLPLVVTDAARAIGLPAPCVDRASPGNLILAEAAGMAALLSCPARRRSLAEVLRPPG